MTASEPRDAATHPIPPTPTRSAVLGGTEGLERATGVEADLCGWEYAVVNRWGEVIQMHATCCPEHARTFLRACLMVGLAANRTAPKERGCAYCVGDSA